MEMSPATAWWIAAGILVATELATGTFYLLMLALGCAAAALAAHLGLGASAQMMSAAAVGGAAVVVWRGLRRKHSGNPPINANPNLNLDIGQTVQVERWAADRSASVRYRGAEWDARYIGDDMPGSGRFIISAVDGNCLLLAAKP
jgi:membrane protein implicated in regulation of membrane protease activity